MMNLAAQRYHFEWLHWRTRGALGSSTRQKRTLDRLVGSSDLAGFEVQSAAVFWMATSVRELGQVFRVEHVLAQAFEGTDVGSLEANRLELPYDAIYIDLPDSELTFQRDSDGVDVPLTALYVARDGEAWWIALISYDETGQVRPVLLAFQWDHERWAASGLGFDAWLEHRYGAEAVEEQAEPYKLALRLVTQLLLYLQGSSPELEDLEEPARKKLARAAERFKGKRRGEQAEKELEQTYTRARVTRVAPTIVGELEDQARAEADATGARRGTWVRGHWRYYWVGPKESSERRLDPRWVLPHWRKGSDGSGPPESAEVRLYQVGRATKKGV